MITAKAYAAIQNPVPWLTRLGEAAAGRNDGWNGRTGALAL
jgi:hypothetical protein